jgi:hypothetical protein
MQSTGPGLEGIFKALDDLSKTKLMVGFPSDDDEKLGTGGPDARTDGPATNALLAYVHETGSPARNIPARPFLHPGVEDGLSQVEPHLRAAATAALEPAGATEKVKKEFVAAGLILQGSVRTKITVGPFVPLAESTKAARRRKHPAAGDEVTPLIDTGQLRAAVNFVIRKG